MTVNTSSDAKAQFDRQAAHYNERWASWSDETLRAMLTLADPQPNWRALDIATGTGFTALAFAETVADVVATDLSPGMLAQGEARAAAQNVANVRFVEAPADAQPFEDATFDLVTCRIAPHHFPDLPAFVREVARVLRPGGVFVLGDTTVPDDDPEAADWQNGVEKERDPSHVANRSPREWETLCADAGLAVTDRDATGGSIAIPLSAWLETAGCDAERSARVRARFADAPESARVHFAIRTDDSGETHFAWQRVVLRAEKRGV